jgi:hypothetical protein
MADKIAIVTPDGVEIRDMTSEEINARKAAAAEDKKVDDAIKAAADQKETDATNGNKKFLDLGLTQAEATALTGYKPEE